jgi:Helix-turn-helix domain
MVTSRIRFTAAQKAELWERWKNGQSTAAISRALERKNKTGVERIVVAHGGIAPAPRRRALAALRFEEREEISRGIAVGRPIRQIAKGLGRAPSTVSREIKRNGGTQVYRATWLIGVPGSGRCAPSLVVWRCIESCDGAWRKSSRCNGRQSRSPAG